MSRSFLAAVVQQAIGGNDKAENMAATAEHVREAANSGAQLVVLQELHATQYFCQVEDTECFDLAEDLDGETYEYFAELAAELDIVLVI